MVHWYLLYRNRYDKTLVVESGTNNIDNNNYYNYVYAQLS